MPCCGTLNQLVQVLAVKPVLSNTQLTSQFTGINTDTRAIKPGEVFVALRGEKFDGHKFVSVALEKGAIAAIVDSDFELEQNQYSLLQVEDTLKAYQQIAHWWRQRFSIPVIAITGSVGKTTTKELIAAVLATQGHVLKTQANYNNEIGVPKTLLELGSEHKYAVIEMAMRAKGEIALLTQITCPTIGVITNVGTAHIERLGSEQAIAEAKCELLAKMPSSAVAILNQDNSRLMATAATVWRGQTVTYGLEGGDLHGEVADTQVLVDGMQLALPLAGRHNATNFLAALAVAKVLQINWSCLKAGLVVDMPSGRSQRHELPNDVVILDETYNAAPEAMRAALHLLAETPGKRRIAVLGAMKELGERSLQLHQEVGKLVNQLNIDLLIVLVDGEDAEAIIQSAESTSVECFSSREGIVERLKEVVREGDRILVKAAHSVGLDRVVNQFCADCANFER
ncbi:UDP-N-acetylmuramoyl-tripeptide--D-alanyl-D-alanine ligase [Gloeocapsopsis dulcis]|uniref:UDP-N-acetylmuramoyl-tripeptide--D-alanyl-D-alanine ligase n=1 Tax=Gloeocapsopsis dulcis AAB1 = 1H9 TaxID=1433147 RepID=A0A6N8FXQ8_9CHRO|nr:UDP-N-acetylmuramoyl-tripeptide--D-alanyl-D-alanine ligase [Gloeocapsopsis dulcis]MUL37918.1 UDP-N-acetylmuramoyl-tripeptide--D-alanyl-D-alanine ligase [Gloeocapsopsis dulcis AAB1 = 1H9]WNN87313.1 UDP-N-acetylmuramoyl-tripeptide--D-alanyl-D-alanine ligase [Gloeocapsopsis dulcis]